MVILLLTVILQKIKVIFESIQQVLCDSNIYSGIIIDDNSKENVNLLLSQRIPYSQMVALCLKGDSIDNWKSVFINNSPIYNIIPYSPSFRHIRKGRVMLDDKFDKLPRNSDYLNCDDEFFPMTIFTMKMMDIKDFQIIPSLVRNMLILVLLLMLLQFILFIQHLFQINH